MPALSDLARAARDGLAFVRAQPGVREVEVFVSENRTLLTRLNYTSHIPCNGVEEPKSAEMYGVGIQVAFDSPEGVLIGFGSEPSDLSTAGMRRAFDKARQGAVRDPEFRSLPRPGGAAREAKGSGWSTGTRLDHFTDEAGVEAAQRAIEAIGGERIPSGDYTVIFGRQPVADLMNNLVVPSCQAGSFYASSTPFLGKLGKLVASPRLSFYDHGAMPGF